VRMSLPAVVLRLESLAVAGAALALYIDGDYAIWALLAFLLAPTSLSPRTSLVRASAPSATTSRTHTSFRSRWLRAACSPEKPGFRCSLR
jgi:hypothetical protein